MNIILRDNGVPTFDISFGAAVTMDQWYREFVPPVQEELEVVAY